MNALTEYIIGNVVASVCIFHKKICKKQKQNEKKAPKLLNQYCKSTRLLDEDSCLYMYLFVKYVHREKRHMQFEK